MNAHRDSPEACAPTTPALPIGLRPQAALPSAVASPRLPMAALGVCVLAFLVGCSIPGYNKKHGANSRGLVKTQADGLAMTSLLALGTSDYLVVDLLTGAVQGRSFLIPWDPLLGTVSLAFRRVPTSPETWIAVTELSRLQWMLMGGGRPWDDPLLQPWNRSGDLLPATGMSPAQARATLNAWSVPRGLLLRLPSAQEWLNAAAWSDVTHPAAGGRTAAAWGLREAGGSIQPTGSGPLNTWALSGTVGNVWELCDDNRLRGGSWHAGISDSAPIAAPTVDDDTRLPDVGLRPVLLRWPGVLPGQPPL